jgi:hypothetical protein
MDILPVGGGYCGKPLSAAAVAAINFPVGFDVPAGGYFGSANATLQIALAPTPSTGSAGLAKGDGWGANDWNNKGATINYTITAEPTAASLKVVPTLN